MGYVIVNKHGTKLTAFHQNDIPDVFHFSNRSYDVYCNKKQAVHELAYILGEIENNMERWGTEWTEKHLTTALSLRIKKDE